MNDYILIEYSNSSDIINNGDVYILYQNAFENKIYLDADVSKPEYPITEEGIENGNGEFSADFQKWEKRYAIVVYAQEFLVDALTLMAIHDQVYITLKNGESSKVYDVVVDVKWFSTIECWAEVVIKFSSDYISINGCNEQADSSCLDALYLADDVYDADDGGAVAGTGQYQWEHPEEYQNTISFFYISTYGCGIYYDSADQIGFFKSIDGEWVLLDMDYGDVAEVTGLATPNWLIKVSDTKYQRVPYLCSVTDETGGVASLKVLSTEIESIFFQVQADDGGGYVNVGDPALASKFDIGYEVTVGAGTYDFRIHWYTHSCDYGYSNVVNETIT